MASQTKIEFASGLPMLESMMTSKISKIVPARSSRMPKRTSSIKRLRPRRSRNSKSKSTALRELEEFAEQVRNSGNDRKWEQLSSLLQENEHMFDEYGNRRKLVIFTEHRDTLNYLTDRITHAARGAGSSRHDQRRDAPRTTQGCSGAIHSGQRHIGVARHRRRGRRYQPATGPSDGQL